MLTDVHAVRFELIGHDEANEGRNLRTDRYKGDPSVTEEQDIEAQRAGRTDQARFLSTRPDRYPSKAKA